MQKALIVAGLTILVIGLLWPWLSKLPLGRLPGDIAVEREGFRFNTRRTWILRKARCVYRAREQGTTTSNSGLYCEES